MRPLKMMSDPFRTEVEVPDSPVRLSHSDHVLLMGSCFSEHISDRMRHGKLSVVANPFGIAFHPMPLARGLRRLASGQPFTLDDLQVDQLSRYCTFDHHTRFSHPDAPTALAGMNRELFAGAMQLRRAKFLFITVGTAWGYVHENGGDKVEDEGGGGGSTIVANCHRLPHTMFEKVLSRPSDVADELHGAIAACRAVNPDLCVVLTVSPVRHIRDGLAENSRSKASLLLAVDEVVAREREQQQQQQSADAGTAAAAATPQTFYFPSYELMLDDLRDYRFYNRDLIHPSELAVDYIWDKLRASLATPSCLEALRKFDAVHRAAVHRPHALLLPAAATAANAHGADPSAAAAATPLPAAVAADGAAAAADPGGASHAGEVDGASASAQHQMYAVSAADSAANAAAAAFGRAQMTSIEALQAAYPYVDLQHEAMHFDAIVRAAEAATVPAAL
jgi:hypothetical protein